MMKQKNLALLVGGSCALMMLSAVVSMVIIWSVDYRPSPTTGFAPYQEGNVTLDISELLSIVIDGQDVINFGSCQVSPTVNRTINSETVDGNGGVCNVTAPGGITIRNDGNVNANVTMQLNNTGYAQGGTFLYSSSNTWSSIAYRTVDVDGCTGNLVGSYATVSNLNNLTACDELGYGGTDSFIWHAQITIPPGTAAGDSFMVTFHANPVLP